MRKTLPAVLFPALLVFAAASSKPKPPAPLQSLNPNEVLSVLDLNQPGLQAVHAAAKQGDRLKALEALRAYYRKTYPRAAAPKSTRRPNTDRADQIVRHIFQWGPYEAADYGPDVNWAWDPRGDIEWVAAVYRFYWARELADAYTVTRDEKYARAFVDLTRDWIVKHPLEKRAVAHPVYTSWRGFPWLDIQTGIRAQNLCAAFKVFVHSEAFTPEFLGILLASLYDHQVKTEKEPMGQVHNKAIFEQRGFVDVCATVRIFKDTRRWMELAARTVEKSLLDQTTPDGVQREWSGGYHLGVLRDAVEVLHQMDSVGISLSETYRDRVRKMFDYLFWSATPDLAFPMFGDTSRDVRERTDRAHLPLASTFRQAASLFKDPKFEAVLNLDNTNLPKQTSYAFRHAGLYVFRTDWTPQQIYMALHCAPPAISSHDQPDNGTFELYAFGRWLMPDTGFYTYGHDAKGRAWHRQTSVHQTLTLDGRNAEVNGRGLLWHTAQDFDGLCVENPSYKDLTHRRTVWFVDKKFFVLLDEAIGNAKGTLDLHFQFAPGKAVLDEARRCASTAFPDANVLVWADPGAPVVLEAESGWHASRYGHRVERPAFRFRHKSEAPAVFLTLVVPYQGAAPPDVSAIFRGESKAGDSRVELDVKAFGESWRIGRDLDRGELWCRK